MSSRSNNSCLAQLLGVILGICLLPVGFILAFALIVSFACALFGAFFGMFIRDEGFFTIFGNILAEKLRQLLYLDEVGEFMVNVLEVLKWVVLGIAGICVAVPALCLVVGGLAGLFWVYWASLWSDADGTEKPRVVRGVRVWYFHWTGGWFRGWLATCGGALDGCLGWRWRNPGKAAAPFVWPFAAGGMLGCVPVALVHLGVWLAVVLLSWLLRVVAAAWLRSWVRAFRTVRECRGCHGWTTDPVWRCPKCGREHRGLVPSAKSGVLYWHCECGARLPTLGVLGRRHLAENCPECGGDLEGVGRAPAGMAFLGAADLGLSRLARAVDGAVEGNRQLRVYEAAAYSPERADFPRQRYWGHVGTVAFAVDPSDLHGADLVWERWQISMGRMYPRRTRQMACAVLLGRSAGSDLSPGDGEDKCRAFLAAADIGGNLLNGLDRTFRRVRFFPVPDEGTASDAILREWAVREAFGAPLPPEARSPGVCAGVFHGRRFLALHLLVLAGLAAFGLHVWWEWREFGQLRGRGEELLSQTETWMGLARDVDASGWSRMSEEKTADKRPALTNSPEGNNLRASRERALVEERGKAAEALSSLEGVGTGSENAELAWGRLLAEIADAHEQLKAAKDEGWAGRKKLRTAVRSLDAALLPGRTALEGLLQWEAARERLLEAEEAENLYWRDVGRLQRQAEKAVQEAGKALYGEDGGFGEHLARLQANFRAGSESMEGKCFEDAKTAFLAVQDEANWLKGNVGRRDAARRERAVAEGSRAAAEAVDGERLSPRQFSEGTAAWRKASEAYGNGRLDEASDGWLRAARSWKEAERASRRLAAAPHLSLARTGMEAGHWLAAFEAVDQAAALCPEESEVLEVLSGVEQHLPPGTPRTLVLPGGADLELVWCPPGRFGMGESRRPIQVDVPKGFWMAKCEVTQRQWQSVMGDNPSQRKGEELPVENVAWAECADWCRRAGHGLRLPTETQWEYACRAGSVGDFAGNLDEMGWHNGNSREGRGPNQTHPVGGKKPNAWGLCDMHGNVREWCDSWFEGRWERVCRGGGYDNSARFCTAGFRSHAFPTDRIWNLGFRPIIGAP